MEYLPCIEIEPKNEANASVIWLHGLGASGDDFAPIVPQLKLDGSLSVRYIFPNAPSRPVTINGGLAMPAWYDFKINGVEREVDMDDLASSTHGIVSLIQREMDRGIPSKRIIVAGFSQGGAIAYQAVMKWHQNAQAPLAGLMAMSTYIADAHAIESTQLPKAFPIHLYHGLDDQVVPLELGLKAKALLEENGYSPAFSEYDMAHSVCIKQVRDIAQFINRVF